MTNDGFLETTISEEDKERFKKLDLCLSEKFPDITRSQLLKLIKESKMTSLLNGERSIVTKNRVPSVGTLLSFPIPTLPDYRALPENIPLEILYEDESVIFINKPQGMVVHPSPGHQTGTLVNALLGYFPRLSSNFQDEMRPGIVHRLDKGTSGVMVVAKTLKAHQKLSETFHEHDLDRIYHAITLRTDPNLSLKGTISTFYGRSHRDRKKMTSKLSTGKTATTHFQMIKKHGVLDIIECKLETGKTHQIRVHLSEQRKSPILRDELYSNLSRQLKYFEKEPASFLQTVPHPFLHAKKLALPHPITGKHLSFETSPPSLWSDLFESVKVD